MGVDAPCPAEELERLGRRSELRLQLRFERSHVAQADVDQHGNLARANDAYLRLVGRDRDQLLGRPSSIVNHETDGGAADALLARILAGEIGAAQAHRVVTGPTGRPVPVLADLTQLRDEDGRPDGAAEFLLDLSKLRDVERRLQEQAEFFRALSQRASDAAMVADAEGRIVYVSPAVTSVFGYQAYDVVASEGWDFVHPGDLPRVRAEYEKVVLDGGTRTYPMRVRAAKGDWRWIELTATNLLRTAVGGIVCNLRDVTERVLAEQALRASEARYRAIADTAEEGIWTVTPSGETTYANGKLAQILGLPLAEVYERPLPSLLNPAQARALTQGMAAEDGTATDRYEVEYEHPDGTQRILLIVTSSLPGPDGTVEGALAMVSDVTDARRAEAELRRAALHDALTGLPNRTLLLDRLEHALARQQAGGTSGTALLFIDLDQFKLLNDSRGHELGDRLLIAVAARLTAHSRPADTVARFGGDEFVVICEDVDPPHAHAIAAGLLAALSRPFDVGGEVVHTTASLGIACSPPAAGGDLLRFADAALHAAKSAGRGRATSFDRALAEEADRRYVLGTDLRAALAEDRLRLHYQPVVDLSTSSVVGMEGLARWEHSVHGSIPPAHFVAIAEQVGLEAALDAWALRTAARDASTLREAGSVPPGAYVAVNISARNIAAPGLEDRVVASAAAAGLAPERIVLEITEGAVLNDTERAIEVLRRLRDHGFGVAIDDFGTGYSSLAYLKTLPITSLKIDRSFVSDITESSDALAIVASIVDLARAVGVTTVAEGVETPEQAALLRRLECPAAQGWLWSRAVAVQDLLQPGGPDWRQPQRRAAAGEAPVPRRGAWEPEVRPEHGLSRLLELHRQGASLLAIADELNGEGYRTPAGARWHPTTVARAVAEIAYPDLGDG